jgi:hypothetical protein
MHLLVCRPCFRMCRHRCLVSRQISLMCLSLCPSFKKTMERRALLILVSISAATCFQICTPHLRVRGGPVSNSRCGPKKCGFPLRMSISEKSETTGTDPRLKERIAAFYDQSSPLWEEVWGEHMHMGESSTFFAFCGKVVRPEILSYPAPD